MVKLAEPRGRNRYTLVPRGKALYEDDARYGTKMLEKMGWSKGKGLGANEDGTKDFVRIRYKNDAQGLGFEARDDQWTQHEQSFNGLLESLNGNSNNDNVAMANGKNSTKNNNNDSDSDTEMRPVGFGFVQTPITATLANEKPVSFKAIISGESLEEKSKNSRARVHYKKFTRGKDLTQYSEKDLANIFGKKAVEEIPNNETTHSENLPESNQSHFQCSTLSVTDYFKAKMEEINKKKQQQQQQKPQNVEESSANDAYLKEEEVEHIEKRKDKKKRKRDAEPMEDEIPVEMTSSKKKKKKEKKNKELNDLIAENEKEAEVFDENIPLETNCENNDEVQNKKKKKKSKKNSKHQKEEHDNVLEEKETEIIDKDVQKINEETELEVTKLKKEKKKKNGKTDATIHNSAELTAVHEKKSKKNKLKAALNVEPIQENEKELVTSSQMSKNKDTTNNLMMDDESEIITIDNNLTPKDKESLHTTKTVAGPAENLMEIENALKAENVYKLSTFAAEQFRFMDVSGFIGSNFADIKGYGIEDDVQLEIVENEYDAKRISQLWSCTIDKYQLLSRPYTLFKEYEKKAKEARKKNEKLPRFKAHQYRRKDAFKTVTI